MDTHDSTAIGLGQGIDCIKNVANLYRASFLFTFATVYFRRARARARAERW